MDFKVSLFSRGRSRLYLPVSTCSVPLRPSLPPDQTPILTDTCCASRTTGAETLPSECSALVGGAFNQELGVF